MKTEWQETRLHDILQLDLHQVEVDPIKTYKMVGVYSFGRGLFHKDTIQGTNTSYRFFYKLKANHVVLSQLFGWEGAIALSSEEFEGEYLSPQFPTFIADESRIVRGWLKWLIKRRWLWNELATRARGMGDRRRVVDPNALLDISIPLPSLSEQRRIVARIEELASRIEEARRLREEVNTLLEASEDSISRAVFESLDTDSYSVRIADADIKLNAESRNPCIADPSGTFIYVDISSVNKDTGTLHRGQQLSTCEAPSRARRVIHKDDIIFSTVRPNLRAIAKVGQELDNQICSTGFAVFSCGPTIDPDYLFYHLQSPLIIDQCVARATGGHYPAINDTNLKNVVIVVPPLAEQKRIADLLSRLRTNIKSITQLQENVSSQSEHLLPSILDKAFKGEL